MTNGYDWHWTFGDRCHIHFPNGGGPVNDTPHGYITGEGCAAVSDPAGNLYFHTDGRNLYAPPPANTTPVNPLGQPLGGDSSTTHSAIIVPPAGGGSVYHVFAAGDWADPTHIGPIRYTPVTVSPTLALVAPTAPLAFGPPRSSERLAAIPHEDCERYWVVSLDITSTSPGAGTLFAMRIDSDSGPAAANTFTQPYPFTATCAYSMKFSPDGSLLALCSMTAVDLLTFNRVTGAFGPHSQVTGGDPQDPIYGVEFSPNGQYLYFTGHKSGAVWRHIIPPPTSTPIPLGSVAQVQPWTLAAPGSVTAMIGALQLGPNGKIYGAKYSGSNLFEIANPDSPTAAGIQFNPVATDNIGQPLTLTGTSYLGLPTFTRIADSCRDEAPLEDHCARLAAQVDEQQAGIVKFNPLRPCDDRQPIEKPECAPIEFPRLAPWTSIRWGDSKCDCIEGDDTEVMTLTVCNPYSNLTLAGLTIHMVTVVDLNGNPVPDLPDGSPSIELTPIGPYCFGDIAPCTCVTRQFVLRLRGAVPGPYRILLRGICFDACFHGDEEDCFIFEVCKD